MENSKKYLLFRDTASHWNKLKQELYIKENWAPEMKGKKYKLILIIQVSQSYFTLSNLYLKR